MESKLNILNLFKIPTDGHGVEVPVLQNQLECSDLQDKKKKNKIKQASDFALGHTASK